MSNTHKVIPPEQGLKQSLRAASSKIPGGLTHKVIPPEQGLKPGV